MDKVPWPTERLCGDGLKDQAWLRHAKDTWAALRNPGPGLGRVCLLLFLEAARIQSNAFVGHGDLSQLTRFSFWAQNHPVVRPVWFHGGLFSRFCPYRDSSSAVQRQEVGVNCETWEGPERSCPLTTGWYDR